MPLSKSKCHNVRWEDWFYYDETSPTCLRWKVDRYSGNAYQVLMVSAGDIAGKKNGERSTVLLESRRFKVPRIVWELHNGKIPEGYVVDHINGNPLDNRLCNLRVVKQEKNTRNAAKRVDNVSGVTGVSLRDNGKGTMYWTARWEGIDGKSQSKNFSVSKFGNEEAFRLACEYREKMIAELNAAGAGYTDDHGKRGC